MDRMSNSQGTWPERTESSNNAGDSGNQSTTGGMTDVASQAKQALAGTAQDTVETAKSAAKEITETAQHQVADTVNQAVSQTADTIAQVKEQAGSVFTDQRDRAVMNLSGLADALRETGKTLAKKMEESDSETAAPAAAIGPFIEDIADRLSSSSDYLKDKDVSQLMHAAEDLARRQPLLFVGALFGVGVVGARLLKGTVGNGNEASPPSPARSTPVRDVTSGMQFETMDTRPASMSAFDQTPVFGSPSARTMGDLS